jgi:hypothetical protein
MRAHMGRLRGLLSYPALMTLPFVSHTGRRGCGFPDWTAVRVDTEREGEHTGACGDACAGVDGRKSNPSEVQVPCVCAILTALVMNSPQPGAHQLPK